MSKKRHELYGVWCSMRNRCMSPSNKSYPRYGGRGVSVCTRWDEFWNFVEDMSARPQGTSLDRIDNDGDYTPENCRWATSSQQARNRRSNRIVVIGNKELTLGEASAVFGIARECLAIRLNRGMSPREALTTPVRKCSPKRWGIHVDGEPMTITAAAKLVGLKPGTLQYRLSHGWSEERALSTPARSCK